MSTKPPADDLLTTVQAAKKLGISRRYLYSLINRGLLTTIRLPSEGGSKPEHRVEPAEIERFKAEHRQPAASAS
jgi:excisionase family DNA binding protein